MFAILKIVNQFAGGIKMSYIRAGYEMFFVEGISEDYVFPYDSLQGTSIEDYGQISNNGIIEILCRLDFIDDRDDTETSKVLKIWLIENLSKKLNVKMKSDWKENLR
jgi:hypothetical protein